MSGRKLVHSAAAPAAIGPYSHGIVANGLVFASGQVGADPATGELASGVVAQAEQALRNLQAVLDAAGTGLDHVVKTLLFLTDMGDFGAVNEVYARHFSPPYPARSTVAVMALPKGAQFEIEAVALVDDGG